MNDLYSKNIKKLKVLDMFCGAGGFSIGFKKAGFNITGADVSEYSKATYESNHIGNFLLKDLSTESIPGDFDIIIGGPPCRPWSSVNTTRRGKRHKDYGLVSKFFETIKEKKPKIFILENVPPLLNDPVLKKYLKSFESDYSIKSCIIKYSDYSAPISRRRLIVFGTNKGSAETFFEILNRKKHSPQTVKDVIGYLKDIEMGEVTNHEWPELKTIDKYREKYESNKFGWYVLDWDKPAPSFGNIMKTYILYPEAFSKGPKRVISVKESLLIMGYDQEYTFPDAIGIGIKYQMVADSVSPVVSYTIAKVIKEMINYNKWF